MSAYFFFFQAEDGIRDVAVTGVQTCALPISNSGASWTGSGAPWTNWMSVAASADGNKLVAVAGNGPIFTSANSGATWTRTSAPFDGWWSVASSADGARLVAAVNGGSIYLATHAGAPWLG